MRSAGRPFGKRLSMRLGFSIVEAVFSIAIVGGLLVAALSTVGASTASQFITADRGRGRLLAGTLMAEILQQAYVDGGASPIYGREANELLSTRADYDDIDDYSGFQETPPKKRDGTSLTGLSGWEWRVSVTLVDPADLTLKSNTDAGSKLVKVTVLHNAEFVAELWSVKTGKPSLTAVPVVPIPDPTPIIKGGDVQLN